MEKIILVCRESGNHANIMAMIEELFPECTVEILMEPGGEPDSINGSVENMGSYFQLAPY